MKNNFEQEIQNKLSALRQENRYRSLPLKSDLIDFCSNDYLGLAQSAEVHTNFLKNLSAEEHVGNKNGSTGSRLLSGNSYELENLELFLAQHYKSDKSLLFNSGYTANLAVLSALPQRGDTILYDELAHTCIKDGARLSAANRYSFTHNDLNDLEKKLNRFPGRKWIAVESIYSMDGDVCPLLNLVELAEKYNAAVILDEAHSTGILGQNGEGLACSHNLHNRVDVRIHTFGKAMGAHGACVVGSNALINFLINFARPFIYTTAPSLHTTVQIRTAIEYNLKNAEPRYDLLKNMNTFHSFFSDSSNWMEKISPIFSLIIGGNDATKKASETLSFHRLDVRPILSPTVKKGTERLRICIHSFNSESDIKTLATLLLKIQEK